MKVLAQGSNSFGFLLRPRGYFHTRRDQGTVLLAYSEVGQRREAGAWKQQQPQLPSTEESIGLVELDAARKDLVDGSSRRATAGQILGAVSVTVDGSACKGLNVKTEPMRRIPTPVLLRLPTSDSSPSSSRFSSSSPSL
ncbi:hypothetical protein MUK42_15164 [Musa troglodytarum]|uniref:Uncharacterized protein n=1 Tax=Musa troglodytarum TaxID=320322 RepID=A0A9E7IFH2_9LILI|nr:hypothetical protein MUK42_15164 [Musa troglodytarum]